jgi:hypothetical protein
MVLWPNSTTTFTSTTLTGMSGGASPHQTPHCLDQVTPGLGQEIRIMCTCLEENSLLRSRVPFITTRTSGV